jgi:hypothetical protein
MSGKKKAGRPYGGTCWLIRDNLEVVANENFNNIISLLKIKVNVDGVTQNLFVFGVWIPFDDGSADRLSTFLSTLSLLEAYLDSELMDGDLMAVIGDFNCDLERSNRFDRLLKKFMSENNLVDTISLFDQEKKYTYEKGDYRSVIDHIICNQCLVSRIEKCAILDDDLNTSDHRPVAAEFDLGRIDEIIETGLKKNKFHFFKWDDNKFKEAYKSQLNKKLVEFVAVHAVGSDPTRTQIDSVCDSLYPLFLKAARDAEHEVGIRSCEEKNKKKLVGSLLERNQEVRSTVERIKRYQKMYKESNHTDALAKVWLKYYKKNLREMMKFHQVESNKKKAFFLDKLIREKNNVFWKKISTFKKSTQRKNLILSKLVLADFSEFYENLFSHNDRPSNAEQRAIEKEVYDYSVQLESEVFSHHFFSKTDIKEVISKLKSNVACGHDLIINEFIKYGCSDSLASVLEWLFNSMLSIGHIPDKFNISMVSPIPKKDEIKEPGDARPISVSGVLSNMLESLILLKSSFLRGTHQNQMGYKAKTSCKHAFFLVNETINYYLSGRSPLFVLSLDASKAFDKLWRAGLFHKIKPFMDPGLWRLLYNYYSKSNIIVKYNNEKSEMIKTSEGVKQGGILSPFLFNYFIDDLLRSCLGKELGAKIKNSNLSIIGYCDDLIIMSPVAEHAHILLKECEEFAKKWKLEFNAKKSVSLKFGKCVDDPDFAINGNVLPKVQKITYLGLPLSVQQSYDYFDEKMKKVEKAFFSLYGLGCKPRHLSPFSIAFIYKQYCQSIIRYGMECLYLPASKLKEYNMRQSLLLKQAVGLSKYAVSTPLLNVLKVEKISEIYMKHKLFFYKQLMHNNLTKEVLQYLQDFYLTAKASKHSFTTQLTNVDRQVGFTCSVEAGKTYLEKIENLFKCRNDGLCDTLLFHLNELDRNKSCDTKYSETRNTIAGLLYN